MILNKLFFILVLLISSSAFADDTYTRYALPLGKRLQVDGDIYRGFNLPEYKELLRMDVRLKEADFLVLDLYKKIELLDGKVLQLNRIVELDNQSHALVMDDLMRKDKLIKDLATKNINLSEKLNKRKRVLRVVLPIIGCAVGGFAAGLAFK
jgi:hypothetical protein